MFHWLRQFRRRLLGEKRFSRYLLYAAGEILLVVIGILIALQIDNWNNQRIERREERQSYQKIRRQVRDDRQELMTVRDFNNYFTAQYQHASQLIAARDRSSMDTLALIAMRLSQCSDFHGSGKIYESLANSGKLNLLRNDEITSGLQHLEMTYNFIHQLEDMHWAIIINELSPVMRGVVNYATLEVEQPARLYSVELQNIFVETLFLTSGKDSIYQRALDEISAIVGLIDEELGVEPKE